MKIGSYFLSKKTIFVVFFLFAVIASFQSVSLGKKTFEEGGIEYNRYNNYTIFERSFHHLKTQQDLYVLYPTEHWDLYKYTPTFSVFFGAFTIFPDLIGLTLWNLLNAIILVIAIQSLPVLTDKQKSLALWICLLELLTSLQNAQSNGLMAGLLILVFSLLEKKQLFWATCCIMCSVYIKLFGIVGFALFLFYPDKIKAAAYALFWFVVLALIPFIFIDFMQYKTLIQSFLNMLKNDHDQSLGYSFMGIFDALSPLKIPKNVFLIGGIIVFLIPYAQIKNYNQFKFRILNLAALLLWIVIFNHKAESPTFIIAIAGIALWYSVSEKNKINLALIIFAFVLTSLSSTDLFPKYIRTTIIHPYALKCLPSVIIWIKIIVELIQLKSKKELIPQEI